MGQPASPQHRKRSIWPMLTLGAGFALLSIAGAPNTKTLAQLTGAGVPADMATGLLHTAPILIALAGIALGVALAKGRGPYLRAAILALVGGVVGFLTARCLYLFTGALPLMEAVTGPLRTATPIDIFAWCLAVLSIVYGLMTAALASFGTPVMQAINFQGVDAEALEVRPRERGAFAQSAVGLIGQGLVVGALAILNQMAPDAGGALRGGATVAMVLGILAFIWSSWVIWRGMDELLRRTVVNAYAWTGGLLIPGALVWALLEALKIVPVMSAYGFIVIALFVQTFVTMFVSAGVFNLEPQQKEAR